MNTQTSQHRQTWDMIPWLVNGSIAPLDRVQAEAHLATCADCRDELAFQSRLHAGLAAPVAGEFKCESGLAKLLSRIDEEDASGTVLQARSTAPHPTKWLVRSLAAVVLLQAVGIAALLSPWQGTEAPAYRTLSTPRPAAADAVVRFVPSPELPLGQVQRVLAANGLRIVDTNATGTIYSLARIDGRPAPSLDETIAELRRTHGVLLAEPIGATAGGR